MKILTSSQAKVLKAFSKFKKCPSTLDLSKKVGYSDEYTRKIMWALVGKKLVKVNKKLKSKKFYI